MKKYYYEFVISWRTEIGFQVSYAYCFADSKSEAVTKIQKSIPYDVSECEFNRFKKYSSKNYSRIHDNVLLWYVDEKKHEHHDVLPG